MTNSIYQFKIQSLTGEQIDFAQFRGKVILITNSASQCGFTPQYEGLQELNEAYADQGLVVIASPCNQFGAQEPAGAEEIVEFCDLNYGVSFLMTQKVDVKGESAHPLFTFLSTQEKGIFGTESIKWNFTKFLINRKGEVIKRYAPTTKPEELIEDIESELAKTSQTQEVTQF